MAVSSFTLNLNGNVAYEDGSSGQFTSFYDSRFEGQVTGSVVDFTEAYLNFETTSIADFIESLLPTIVNIIVAETAGAVVSEYTLHFSGQVAFDDNTTSGYDYEVASDGTVTNHFGADGDEALNQATKSFASIIENAFARILPSGSTVAITASESSSSTTSASSTSTSDTSLTSATSYTSTSTSDTSLTSATSYTSTSTSDTSETTSSSSGP